MTYRTVQTNDRVANTPPSLITRFRWRADRRCRNLNANLDLPFYRWGVRPLGRRFAVVALQNRAEKIERS